MTKATLIVLTVLIAFTGIANAKSHHNKRSNSSDLVTKDGPVETKDGPVEIGGSRGEFIAQARVYARILQQKYGIPPSATIAMAIYESNWGRSYLARKGNNFFGLKALRWNGDTVRNPYDGIEYRSFDSLKDGFLGYAKFLKQDRYQEAFGEHCGKDFIKVILEAGYCPDRKYYREVSEIIDRYDLDRYDS